MSLPYVFGCQRHNRTSSPAAIVVSQPSRTSAAAAAQVMRWGTFPMQFDFQTMTPMDRYELLLGMLPRPITIVTTLSADGAVNAAPKVLWHSNADC